MAGLAKRVAEVPADAHSLGDMISKADLLEAAWHLASLCNDGEGCDDDEATLRRLIDELNTLRVARGTKQLPPIDTLKAKWWEARKRTAEMIARWKGELA